MVAFFSRKRKIVCGISFLIFFLPMLAMSFLGPDHNGVPDQSLFNAIPTEGPYYFDERGVFTEVHRAVYVRFVWAERIEAALGIPAFVAFVVVSPKRRRTFPGPILSQDFGGPLPPPTWERPKKPPTET